MHRQMSRDVVNRVVFERINLEPYFAELLHGKDVRMPDGDEKASPSALLEYIKDRVRSGLSEIGKRDEEQHLSRDKLEQKWKEVEKRYKVSV